MLKFGRLAAAELLILRPSSAPPPPLLRLRSAWRIRGEYVSLRRNF